jgi:hypothetical protein
MCHSLDMDAIDCQICRASYEIEHGGGTSIRTAERLTRDAESALTSDIADFLDQPPLHSFEHWQSSDKAFTTSIFPRRKCRIRILIQAFFEQSCDLGRLRNVHKMCVDGIDKNISVQYGHNTQSAS